MKQLKEKQLAELLRQAWAKGLAQGKEVAHLEYYCKPVDQKALDTARDAHVKKIVDSV